MIISHKHKYVFFELPMTGSTAIANELVTHYAGEPRLAKHSGPKDFWKTASEEEKQYFMFSGIRNPLDQAVSRYYKYKTDHNQNYSGKAKPKKLGWLRRKLNRSKDKSRYNFITKNDASFQDYFMRFYKLPYSNWSLAWHERMDYIMRFEQLNDEFMAVLKKLEISAVRALPSSNTTAQKGRVFWEYYNNKEIKARARNVFGVFMKKWDYEFPDDWSHHENSLLPRIKFNTIHGLRKLYWKILP